MNKEQIMKKRYQRILAVMCIMCLMAGCAKPTVDNKTKESQTVAADATLPQDTKPEETESTKPAFVPTQIDIIAVGDVLLHDPVNESGKMEDGTYNYDHLFKNVINDVKAADMAIVNQEVMLGGRDIGLSGYPAFNGAFEVGDSLAKAGFNIILHATNHTIDRGKTGVLNCMNFWDTKYPQIAYLGINKSQADQDDKIYVYNKGDIKVAVLNYTYGTNGIPLPKDMPYIVNLIDKDKMAADIKKAKERADFVIVCPHWGVEYTHKESAAQRELAQFFLEQGVDLVIGAHPHVIQPVEVMKDDKGNQMIVYYSLGNFINSTADSGIGTADRMVGGMAKITITNDEAGNVFVKEYGIEPLVTQMLFGPGLVTTYKLSDYTEALAKENKIIQRDSRFSLDFCKKLCKDVFGDLYKEQ